MGICTTISSLSMLEYSKEQAKKNTTYAMLSSLGETTDIKT